MLSRINEAFVIFISSHHLKSSLVNYPATPIANVETCPVATYVWRHFIPIFIARLKTIATWSVAADANPCLLICGFVGDTLFLLHALII
jgi:hypothetical protein